MRNNESGKACRPPRPELLAPAGTFEKLVTAIHYGADAVYLSGKRYGLREKAGNFDEDQLREALAYAHQRGVKVYVTVNIFAHNDDVDGLPPYLLRLEEVGVDGLIVADPGVLALARRTVPQLPLHLSTQANVTNYMAAEFWRQQGAGRINLARELSLAELRTIRKKCPGQLEVFVHGALCISYSGRCLLSSYMTGRDANRGHCAHPCRYKYALVEETRPGQYFPVEEDDRGTYIFNSKDLCLLELLPQLLALSVDALKIEGRMKSIFYVGGVVRVYRAALDWLMDLPEEAWQAPESIVLPPCYTEEIRRMGTRGASENFLLTPPGAGEMIYDTPREGQSYEPVAVVLEAHADPLVEFRNRLKLGEEVEYMERGFMVQQTRVVALVDGDGGAVETANPGNRLRLHTEPPLVAVEPHAILRRRKAVVS
jgi:U32 family peptidase